MSEKRRDNRNRILREGEYQRKMGGIGSAILMRTRKEKNVYSWRLDKMTQCQREEAGAFPA